MASDEQTRIRSLASTARALARSEALRDQLEIAAEGARVPLRAATVSLSRLVPGSLRVRTVVNVGDQLIQAVARDLRAAFRGVASALVARVGGDEFTVLVSGADPADVLALSDRMCGGTWGEGVPSGVSAGAATVLLRAGDPLTPTDLFAAADRAQYVAKRGRLATTVMSVALDPAVGPPGMTGVAT